MIIRANIRLRVLGLAKLPSLMSVIGGDSGAGNNVPLCGSSEDLIKQHPVSTLNNLPDSAEPGDVETSSTSALRRSSSS